MRSLSANSTVVLAEDQVSSDLGGEAVILNLKDGRYYGLDAVAARVWKLIETPRRVADVRDILVDEYDVESDRCERDLLALLQRLADERLIEVSDEAPA